VQLLLDAGAAVNAAADNIMGDTALQIAAQGGHAEVVQLLLEAQTLVDAASPDGCTALHTAAYRGYPAVVKLLMDAGAAVDAAVSDGCTALQYAVWQGHTAVVQLLVSSPQVTTEALIRAVRAASAAGRASMAAAAVQAVMTRDRAAAAAGKPVGSR
jgi:ankyrin repeat protein